jgi:hypothetical protein
MPVRTFAKPTTDEQRIWADQNLYADTAPFLERLTDSRMRTWLPFWLFVVVSWAAVGFYLLISGWAPCTVTGTCVADAVVVVLALLLMPVQVLLAVYRKQPRAD